MGRERFSVLKSPKRRCRTCEYEWFLRAKIKRRRGKKGAGTGAIFKVTMDEPANCPLSKCKSPYWNKPWILKKRRRA